MLTKFKLLKPWPRRLDFATDMLRRIDDDAEFLNRIMVSEDCFHLSGIVNRHNVRIWGSEISHEYREVQRDSPKVNVWVVWTYVRPRHWPFLFH
ncbi:hypothetical protein AVEN_263842-1 [Araneus ventricosus]|uniref:Uncharacterized protein n=1 Tax=Araneus ventricosus TaxID=182803 RepID=A0A4Y2DYL2_ARAVE|nr:hypothetical protein AVEN_263842-1 [Araneus ventricosus]